MVCVSFQVLCEWLRDTVSGSEQDTFIFTQKKTRFVLVFGLVPSLKLYIHFYNAPDPQGRH